MGENYRTSTQRQNALVKKLKHLDVRNEIKL